MPASRMEGLYNCTQHAPPCRYFYGPGIITQPGPEDGASYRGWVLITGYNGSTKYHTVDYNDICDLHPAGTLRKVG
jgi:hypothetical protein